MNTQTSKKAQSTKRPQTKLSAAVSKAVTNQIDAKLNVLGALETFDTANSKVAALLDATQPGWLDYAGNKGWEKCNQSQPEYLSNQTVRNAMVEAYKARGLDDVQIKHIILDTKRHSINFKGPHGRHPEVKARQKKEKEAAAKKAGAAKKTEKEVEQPVPVKLLIAAYVATSPTNAREVMVETIAGLSTLIDASGNKKVSKTKLAILERANKCIQSACEAMADYNK